MIDTMKTPKTPTAEEIRANLEAEYLETLASNVREMLPMVRGRLGEERIALLSAQPPAIAAGGFAAVLQEACTQCAGYPQPVVSAACRVLQLCGSVPKPEDTAP